MLAIRQSKEFISRFVLIADAAALLIGTWRVIELLLNRLHYLLALRFNQILLLQKISLVKQFVFIEDKKFLFLIIVGSDGFFYLMHDCLFLAKKA